jgi:hypothetical protein
MNSVIAKIRKKINLYFQRRHLNKGDVILASFPKCGNTFCRFVFSRILSKSFGLDREVDFQVVQDLTPTMGDSLLNQDWNYQGFPRVIKTHETLDPHFLKGGGVIYVMRDPRDMIISYYHWMKAHKKVKFSGTMTDFILHENYGIKGYIKHIASWKGHWNYLFIYRDLMTKGDQLFLSFFNDWRGMNVDLDVIKEAVRYSLPENARVIEETKGNDVRDQLLDGEFRHVRSGKFDQWKSTLTETELDIIENLSEGFFSQFGFDLSER